VVDVVLELVVVDGRSTDVAGALEVVAAEVVVAADALADVGAAAELVVVDVVAVLVAAVLVASVLALVCEVEEPPQAVSAVITAQQEIRTRLSI